MSGGGELRWSADGDTKVGPVRYLFLLDPVAGLSDIDRHPITDEGWKHMQAPSPEVTAELGTPSWATVEELFAAIATLREKGRFQSIVIRIQTL